YRVTFVSGGGATDVRSRDLAADVECVGSVTQADYEATADLIVTEGLLELGPQYGFHPDYPPTVFTTATRDGNETTVRNYPGAAPAALVRIQQAIRGLRERVA